MFLYQPKDRNKNDSSRVITTTQAVNTLLTTFARTSQGNTISTKKERLELTKTNVLNKFNNIRQKEDTDQFFGLTRTSYLPKNCYAKMSSIEEVDLYLFHYQHSYVMKYLNEMVSFFLYKNNSGEN